jgi:hypothetical protein
MSDTKLAGRRYRVKATPIQLRNEYRERLVNMIDNRPGLNLDPGHVAFIMLSNATADDRLYYSNAQLAGITAGLRLGLDVIRSRMVTGTGNHA